MKNKTSKIREVFNALNVNDVFDSAFIADLSGVKINTISQYLGVLVEKGVCSKSKKIGKGYDYTKLKDDTVNNRGKHNKPVSSNHV